MIVEAVVEGCTQLNVDTAAMFLSSCITLHVEVSPSVITRVEDVAVRKSTTAGDELSLSQLRSVGSVKAEQWGPL